MTGEDVVEILKYIDDGTNELALESIVDNLGEINNSLGQINHELRRISSSGTKKRFVQQELPFDLD